MLLLAITVSSTPAAPQTLAAAGQGWRAELGFQYYAQGWPAFFQGLFGPQSNAARPAPQPQVARDEQVTRLQVYPAGVTLQPGGQAQFVALGYDANNQPVGGLHLQWRARDVSNNRVLRMVNGLFAPRYEGQFVVEARFRNLQAQVTVTRLPGAEPNPATPGPSTPVSTRNSPPSASQAQRARPARAKTAAKSAHARRAAPMFLPNDGWNNGNYWAADDYGNRVGDVPGAPADGGAGSGNFQFAAPVLSLPGRGIDVALGLAYNSRLWTKAGSEITYDIDRGWPAPGWNLGFGKIVGIAPPPGAPPGQLAGALLIEPDGTRHSYEGTMTNFGPGQNRFVGHTTDGSFIDYEATINNNGKVWNAAAFYPNGTIIRYNAYDDLNADPEGRAVYPTSITDASGNIVTIVYANNIGPRISFISDTLGRTINFHYDANNLLTAITAPTIGGGTRQLVRLHYKTLALDYSFPGLTTRVANASPWALDAIYYPATGTGYWFGDADAYSSYGMLAKVQEKRGLSFSASAVTEQGTIANAGQTTQEQLYNYQMAATPGLSDAPTYTQLTEKWTKDGVSDDQATTTYALQPNANPRTTAITLPNGLTSTQYSYNEAQTSSNPNAWRDGLVYSDTTTNGATTVQSSAAVWEKGAYSSPRPVSVTQTDERNQTAGQEFSYGSLYNQVTEAREYGYGYVYGDPNNPARLLRRTTSEYENGSAYLWSSNSWGGWGRHIFNLPRKVERYAGYAGGGVKMARTEYQYDGQPLINAQSSPPTPGVVAHGWDYNPYSGTYTVTECLQWSWDPYYHCEEWAEIEYPYYNPATAARGNVTQVKSWADATAENDPNAVVETRQYDITGNLRVATTACCQQMSYDYTNATQFAYPEKQTRGSATDMTQQVTTSAVYDFNTGLATGGTDADGRTGSTVYDTASLRPWRVNHALAATVKPHTDFTYNDTAMTVAEDTYLDDTTNASALVSQNVKLLNGQGQVRQEQARGAATGANQWDYVDTEYDNLGRVVKQTRPYRYGVDTPQWLYTYYDALGRTSKTIVPDGTSFEADGTTPKGHKSEYFYNETTRPSAADQTAPGQTTRLRDAWGRERWGRADASGNLVEVVEPNPDGDGTVASGGLQTTYQYDALNRLTQTTQGAQTRKFAYDSLGRLTRQKLAETAATLNDAGGYVGAGSGVWGDAFVYDLRSNLTQRTDARGVKTNFSYNSDPLNRLQSVSYDTTGEPFHNLTPGDPNYYQRVADTATVSYTYRTRSGASDLKDVTEVQSVTTAGISADTYAYDSEGRVASMTTALNSRAGSLTVGYLYDSLDRVTEVYYPNKVWTNTGADKIVRHDYDIAGRLSQLTIGGVAYASQIQYNASSQTIALNIGPNNGNQLTENYAYDPLNGLLTNQTVTRTGNHPATLLNLSYDYQNPAKNNKIMGALVKLTDNLNAAKNKTYDYDALGRLTKALGGSATNPVWAQRYSYDRYGNRANVFSYHADQYVTNFYQVALNRQPDATELQTWLNNLQTAYGQGQTQYLAQMQSLGATLFTSQEYLNRGRTNADFVSDLYRTYLFRDPDGAANDPATGWGYWTNLVAQYGRDAVRDAFATSGEFALKIEGTSPSKPAGGATVPRDGWEALSFDTATNRITTAGFAYDAAGNQTQTARVGGGYQRYQYDAANRLVKVYDGNNALLQSVTYGATNQRLVVQDGDANSNNRTYYAAAGDSVLAEYVETPGNPTTPTWSKTYLYLGARLLATFTPNGGGEYTQYHHPDRLGTRLLTNASDTTAQEQATLPFGTALDAESTGATNRRFTSYDRSAQTGLDYAVNRTYDSQQGRFTQVDPIEMSATSLSDPQSLNLYSYVGNDPVNRIDPSGLFWGKLFRLIGKIINIIKVVVAVALAVIAIWLAPALSGAIIAKLLIYSGLLLADVFAPRPVKIIIGLALLAYGIYTSKPGIIVNHNDGVYGDGDLTRLQRLIRGLFRIAPYLSLAGAITRLQGQGDIYTTPKCPPGQVTLKNSPVVKSAIQDGIARQKAFLQKYGRTIEHGGWIFWKKGTNTLRFVAKAPITQETSPNGHRGQPGYDGATGVYLNNPPALGNGWVAVATYHLHPQNLFGDSGDITATDQYKVPGITGLPNGQFKVLGNYSSSIFNQGSPKGCK